MSDPPERELTSFDDVPDPLARSSHPEADARRSVLRLPRLEAAPERATVRRRRLVALAASAAWIGAHLFIYGVREDLAELPALYLSAQVLLPFVVGTISLFVAFASGRLGLGAKIGFVSALAILGPATFALIALGAPPPHLVPDEAGSLLGIFVCFDITVAWAAIPLLAAALTLRGAFPTASRWRSALVGAGAGLFAGATMNLHCSNIAPVHVLLGHGLPVAIAALVGALVLAALARA
jgi:hypothetical protein